MLWRIKWWLLMLFNPKLKKEIDDAFDKPDPTPPPEWGKNWRFALFAYKPDSTPDDEAKHRWQWAKSAGLVEQRFDEHGNSFIRKNDPDWWDKAGEALALLRGESLVEGCDEGKNT